MTDPPIWFLAKQHIEEQIALGTYTAGSWLPSVRQLAAQLGVNRNTASKAYQALAREGITEAIHGRGVRVIGASMTGPAYDARLRAELNGLARQARAAGVSEAWLLDAAREAFSTVFRGVNLTLGFIECNEFDVRYISQDLERHLGMPVEPIVLDQVMHDPACLDQFDVVTTTFFHLQDVPPAIGPLGKKVVGIHHTVSHETILEIAKLRPGLTVAVLCPNERTLDRVQHIVESYARVRVVPCASPEPAAISEALASANAVILHALMRDAVADVRPDLPVITVRFHIEQQSIEYLREDVRKLLARIQRAQGSSSPARVSGVEARSTTR